MIRRSIYPFVLIVAAILLTGCQTVVTTRVDVKDDVVHGSFEVRLLDEAAKAVLADPASDQKLLATLTDRSGTLVDRKTTDNAVTYRSGLPADNSLVPISGVGISGVSSKGGQRLVELRYTLPNDLSEAIDAANEGMPDAAARKIVMQRTTLICATVSFAGSVDTVQSSGTLNIVRGDRDVTACTNLEALSEQDATLSVLGNPNRSLIVPAGIMSLAALALFALYRRRLSK
jgi:hypothetical protein